MMDAQLFKEQQLLKIRQIEDAFKLIREKETKFIDLRFVDLSGNWQHFSIPANKLQKDNFYEGFGFDGSAIKGWKDISESDLIAVPDPSTIRVDPFMEPKNAIIICDIIDTVTRQPYILDPRYIAKKAMDYIISTGVADRILISTESGFFISDNPSEKYSSDEIRKNLCYKGYSLVPPDDSFNDLRNIMVENLVSVGIDVEKQHHASVNAEQAIINYKYSDLPGSADNLMLFRYVIKNTAAKAGKNAIFAPKPIDGEKGNGMHVNISMRKNNEYIFAGTGYGNLSETALHFIGGLIKHSSSLLAFTNPTESSYKRLVREDEAPIYMTFSKSNRSAAIRIPTYTDNPKSRRIEFRTPDSTANPYLAFAAIAMAGIDGVLNHIEPGEPTDKNIFRISDDERNNIPRVPEKLSEAHIALKNDNEYLKAGEVFPEELITNPLNSIQGNI